MSYSDFMYELIYDIDMTKVHRPEELGYSEINPGSRTYGSAERELQLAALAREISHHGLLHPPTLARSKLHKGKFVIVDGQRRCTAYRELKTGKYIGCSVPKNWRAQVLKDKYFDDLSRMDVALIRLGANEVAEKFYKMDVARTIGAALDELCREKYNESWKEIANTGKRATLIKEELIARAPFLLNIKGINKILKNLKDKQRISTEVQAKIAKEIPDKLSTQTHAWIAEIDPIAHEASVDVIVTASNDGRKNAEISNAAKETVAKFKRGEIPKTSKAISRELKRQITNARKVHTFSINQCPRSLSTTVKAIAKREALTPSELCMKTLRAYISDNPTYQKVYDVAQTRTYK